MRSPEEEEGRPDKTHSAFEKAQLILDLHRARVATTTKLRKLLTSSGKK